ncbi:MAG: ubiquinone biosynthesis regulatory protein kinase UbiB [Pseudomonadales bacterium]|jgi:ubiquinone biosynthesis protein|nr:ubiquinone biosynthesis regulatory protein kinase UbiB [Pseudomonadales bacterium]MDP6471786.1 ubiquinone biosynthesis regulatory protein kinase UbiB [Pseudomonadales bacterium]MDP6828800.1 ubiquinone biosynthesis regulatory protein kinase UbiB [Pseudomonadales bacterium]|tara:strand:- start:2105 stop:3769 length:1665 start_codon:yes stop_codon:yes gene_type:complete
MKRRLAIIVRTFIRYRLDELLPEEGLQNLPWWIRTFARAAPSRWLPKDPQPPGVRLRMALETLGPVFVKFGQLLSTRRDLLPPEIADELTRLQDDVPPFPGPVARDLTRAALGESYEEHIRSFDENPIASASIAQVHGAVLRDGSQVVVKVVRPDIAPVIGDDLEVLRWLASWVHERIRALRRLHLPEVVADYAATILKELDMRQEAANTQQLRQNFAASQLLYVPRVHRHLTRDNVLVLERITGIPIGQVDQLHEAGVNMEVLANRGVQTFFTQVFVHNFFHADMHPGNIFVDARDPESPRYIALDCAIVGSLTPSDQDYLARNLVAFFNRDYRQVARLHLESGWIPDSTDEAEFERVIREVCDPIFAKPLNEISFAHFLVELFRTAAEFQMEIQPQLVLLQKTLLYIEGLGRQLYPQLDLWETAKPFMDEWLAKRVGPLAAMRSFTEAAPQILEHLPRLPELIINSGRQLRAVEHGLAEQRAAIAELRSDLARIRSGQRWRRWAGATLAVVAAFLLWEPVARMMDGFDGTDTLTASAGLFSAAAAAFLLLRG